MLRIISELEIVGVYDRRVPNKERIHLKAHQAIDIGNYFILLGVPGGLPHQAFPITTDIFWFGNEIVSAGTAIFVYTGLGQRQTTRMPTGEPTIVLHWNKPMTLFNHPIVVPFLVSVEGIFVPSSQEQFSLPGLIQP